MVVSVVAQLLKFLSLQHFNTSSSFKSTWLSYCCKGKQGDILFILFACVQGSDDRIVTAFFFFWSPASLWEIIFSSVPLQFASCCQILTSPHTHIANSSRAKLTTSDLFPENQDLPSFLSLPPFLKIYLLPESESFYQRMHLSEKMQYFGYFNYPVHSNVYTSRNFISTKI